MMHGAIGPGVIDHAVVAIVCPGLAQVGEVETAMGVEHQVVRTVQPVGAAAVVQHCDSAAARIDTLDTAADVIGRNHGRAEQVLFQPPGETAIVADVERTIRTNGGAIRPSAGAGDHLNGAVRQHPAEGLPLDFDQHDRPIADRYRAFREAQPGCHTRCSLIAVFPACPAAAHCCLGLPAAIGHTGQPIGRPVLRFIFVRSRHANPARFCPQPPSTLRGIRALVAFSCCDAGVASPLTLRLPHRN